MRLSNRLRVSIGLVFHAVSLCLTGCATHTAWDAYGEWRARTTLPGREETSESQSIIVIGGTQIDDPVRLCDFREVSVLLPSRERIIGAPALIRIQLARPLCRTGTTSITGGKVHVWTHPVADTSQITSIVTDVWTVTGELNVTHYRSFSIGDLEVGDRPRTTETEEGTFTITATDTAGSTIRLKDGTFMFEVLAHRYKDSLR